MEQVPGKSQRAWLYFFIVSLDSLSFCLIAPILAPLLAQHQLFFNQATAYYQYGILIALFPLSYMVASPCIGYCSDKWGRKPLLLVCLSFMLAAFIAYAYAFHEKSFVLLMLGRLLAGFGASSQGIAQAAMVDQTSQRKKPQAIAFIAVAMTLGLFVGPLIASLWREGSSTAIFIAVSVLIGVNIVMLGCYREESVSHRKKSHSLKNNLTLLIAQPRLLCLLGIFFLFELGWSLYYQALPLILSFAWHFTNTTVGWMSAYVGAILSVFLIVGAKTSLLASRQQIAPFALFAGACAFLLSGLFLTLPTLLVSAIPIAVAVAIIYPSLIAEIAHLAGENAGFVIGLAGSLLALAFATTGFLSGLLVAGNAKLPLLLAAFLWLVARVGWHYLGVKHVSVS